MYRPSVVGNRVQAQLYLTEDAGRLTSAIRLGDGRVAAVDWSCTRIRRRKEGERIVSAVVNIINFIRGVEPRDPQCDLVGTVRQQIDLARQHGFPVTWLLQYDALIDPRFQAMMRDLPAGHEIGIWFETPQPLVERAGLRWRGRPGYAWDWHAHVGFSVGYSPAEREAMADVCMSAFRELFGAYPRSVGSWFMDAHLLAYLCDRYGIEASCNCRDQIGTDGYTLWGGYWAQAYYPSRRNAYVPAQSPDQQIGVPVFRMLGSDPIYQYSAGLGENGQGVVTLEPVYAGDGGGGDPKWVSWYFDSLTRHPSLHFTYAQVGQENSFGWPAMHKGLMDQFNRIHALRDAGAIRLETLGDTGRWFRKRFSVTPATTAMALADWRGEGRRSVWYNSRYYRANLFWDGEALMIRDLHLFDQAYAERYLKQVCASPDAAYDTLPVCDGFVWSDRECAAGIRLYRSDGRRLGAAEPIVNTDLPDRLDIRWNEPDSGTVHVSCTEETLGIRCDGLADWHAEMGWARSVKPPITGVRRDRLTYRYEQHPYSWLVTTGRAERKGAQTVVFRPEQDTLSWSFRTTGRSSMTRGGLR